MGKACNTNGVKIYAYRILVGKPERKRQLRVGRPRRRCVDNIKERYYGVVWTRVIWLRIGTSGLLI
jgi:hypothetical protein